MVRAANVRPVSNPNIRDLISMQGMPQMGQRQIMTEADRQEVMRVQAMQVRTQAAQMASMMLQHRQVAESRWTRFADHIARYIWEGTTSGDAVPPVQPQRPPG